MQRYMSNKHGNQCAIQCIVRRTLQKSVSGLIFRFLHPFACMVAGMTGSSKTVWVKSLLQQAQEIIHLHPERIVWCYSQWQPAYKELMVTTLL